MSSRLLGSILLSYVYRSGKHKFKAANMCASPLSHSEPQTSELKIAGSSTDPQHQENFAEQSFSSSTSNFDVPQLVDNLNDDTAIPSEEGTKLSKRALKRVRC